MNFEVYTDHNSSTAVVVDGEVPHVRASSNAATPAAWFLEWAGGRVSDSGVKVNGSNILTYGPVWYAVNRIAGHIGYLPLNTLQTLGERRKRKADDHPASLRLKKKPNDAMTPSAFKETLQEHALLWGNGRAVIDRDRMQNPMRLIPLMPDRTTTVIVGGQKWHVTTVNPTPDKETLADSVIEQFMQDAKNTRIIPDRDVLHIPGLGYDGVAGYSLISLARNSFGLGLAAEKHSNRHFRNNAAPNVVLEAPPGAFRDETQAKEFIDAWNTYHQGLDNVDKAGMLWNGVQAKPLQMSGKDSQWIEQRQFQRQEAALWFLLEAILGDDSSVAYKSLEQKNIDYISRCLMRWIVKWEEECNRKLLSEDEFLNQGFYHKFNLDALLRGTAKERYEVYQIGIANRIINPNDAREKEDMDEYEGGDEYMNPAITPGPTEQQPQDRFVLGNGQKVTQ